MNINQIMKQAQAMQKKMEEMQSKLADQEVTGASGGNMVKVTLNGKGEAKKVSIDKSLMKPEDTEILEDLIVAAINNAKSENEAKISEEMGKLTSQMGLPPGMKLPF